MHTQHEQAIQFTADTFAGQKRLNGDSYKEYASQIIAELIETPANEFTLTLAALVPLHGHTEHMSEVKKVFGSDIARSLAQYHRLTNLKIQNKSFSNEAAQMFLIIAHNPHVTLIRLAERIVNLNTAQCLEREVKDDIAQRAFTLYAPLAEIIGLQKFNNSIKRHALALASRNHYLEAELIQHEYQEKVEDSLGAATDHILNICKTHDLRPHLHSRFKGLHSIHAKLQKYALQPSRKDPEIGDFPLADLGGIRILLQDEHECFTCFSLIQSHFNIVVLDDYITNPKPNGYQGIHCIVEDNDVYYEIQIKSHNMHHHNEFGAASHFFYKLQNVVTVTPKRKKQDFNWVEHIHQWHHEVQNKPFEEIPFFKKNIYTLTPKGDVIVLPKGAVALDFAYAIHKQVGDQCERAFINDALASLDQELENGDIVTIHTNIKRKPTSKALDFVKTKKARTMIRKSLAV